MILTTNIQVQKDIGHKFIENHEDTYISIKRYMGYSGGNIAISIILLILCILTNVDVILMKIIWLIPTQGTARAALSINGYPVIKVSEICRIICICKIFIDILLIIFMLYHNSIKTYYCNEKTYKHVSNTNGKIIFTIISIICILISFLRYIWLQSFIHDQFIWFYILAAIFAVIPFTFDIIYKYKYNNQSEKEYVEGNVYKYVKQFSTMYVYKYNPKTKKDVCVYEFTVA